MSRIATSLLVEFVAALSNASEPEDVWREAVERATHSLEAEVGAIVLDDRVVACVGFAEGCVPIDEVVAAARGARTALLVPGVGTCQVCRAELAVDTAVAAAEEACLLLARNRADPFNVEELHLARGMARVLELRVQALATLARVRERQRLLEQLGLIQRAITRRESLDHILDTVAGSARELLGDDVVVIDLMPTESRSHPLVVASSGMAGELARRLWRAEASAGESLSIVQDGITTAKVYAALAAPVHENAVPVGSMTVASTQPDRLYKQADHDMLRSFADHVSQAVTDAMTVKQMEAAFHDSLTGLASRKLFMDRLEHALTSNPAHGDDLVLMFIDLDRFKQVNDSLGHTAGDQLLVQVAERLGQHLRSNDLAARFGGDEFAVLFENVANTRDPETIADRILASLEQPFQIESREVFITASIGIATGASCHDPETLVRSADLAMYEAKHRGKARSEVYAERMQAELATRVTLEGDLRHAIDRDELIVFYQPIVSLRDLELVGLEAVVCWRHPERGLIQPVEFLPLAEETGIIFQLGRWVLGQACSQAAKWNAMGRDRPVFVNVNLSARQVHSGGLHRDVADALSAASLPPQLLTLELTDTVLPHELGLADAALKLVRPLGVRIALDDFGTGYSSLLHLAHLRIDELKLDRTFLRDATADSRAEKLLQAIIQLGRSLDLTVVAEGIEHDDQLALLRSAGCELGQGMCFSAPVEPDQITRLLASKRRPRLHAGRLEPHRLEHAIS